MSVILLVISTILWTFTKNTDNPHKKNQVDITLKKPQISSVELVVGGDIMLSRSIWRWAKQKGYDYVFTGEHFHPLSQFPCYTSGTCLLVFNLESMFSENDNDYSKETFWFRANTWNIQTLLDLQGKNQLLLSLSNNHTNNAGAKGVQLTREWLKKHDIGFFGAGNSTWEAQKIYQLHKNGIHFCFQAFSYDGNAGIYGGEPLAWNPLHLDLLTGMLAEMKHHGCDVKVIMPHRWAEYRIHPSSSQINLAHQIIDAGADMLLGGHSHVPWKYEIYHGKPIFYSFGNFLFDQDWGKTMTEYGFDYIYDAVLKRKTVPTYLPLLASLTIQKTWTGISILPPVLKMARLDKGIFSPLDEETFSGIRAELFLAPQSPENIEESEKSL